MSSQKHKIIGTVISKVEAELAGFDFEMYDYEAKMVATLPGTLIIDSVFRIFDKIAVTLNGPENTYFMVKLDNEDNKGIAFEPMNQPIRVATKAKVFGETFNTKELIEALKNPIFEKSNDAPVSIHAGNNSEVATIIFECPSCDKLHIFGGYFEGKYKDGFYPQNFKKIYLNKSNNSDIGYITKNELLKVLENIPKIMPVLIETLYDDRCYTLTNVFKCSEKCPSIHLDSAYDENNFKQN